MTGRTGKALLAIVVRWRFRRMRQTATPTGCEYPRDVTRYRIYPANADGSIDVRCRRRARQHTVSTPSGRRFINGGGATLTGDCAAAFRAVPGRLLSRFS